MSSLIRSQSYLFAKITKIRLDYFCCQNYNNYAYQSFYFRKHAEKDEDVDVSSGKKRREAASDERGRLRGQT